jgi:RNA polymerase-binding transcription factor DksA
MDKKIIEELKTKLEEQKESLVKELGSFATKDPNLKHNWDTKYPNNPDGDKDDEADEAQEYDNKLSLEYSLELNLKNVNIALEKIAGEKYGTCENCGKEIEKERLEAIPEAKLCMKCNNK